MKPRPAPAGLRPAPRHAPAALRTTDDLRRLQRLMTHVLVRPLTPQDRLQKKWRDGRPMAQVAAEFIKPNDRLTAFERLELYNRMYWFRLLDCLHDDNPGLRALLGPRKFAALSRAYLARYPSRSFTLRNLSARLEKFLREDPAWTAPQGALARDIVRFEWAQTVAFDGANRPTVTAEEIAGVSPARLRLGLQPFLTLLALRHPVDDYVIAVKQREALRGAASNTVNAPTERSAPARRLPRPRPGRIWVAVHRVENRLYYKRLTAPAYRILRALQSGQTLGRAVAAAGRGTDPEDVRRWFATWMELGWFCARE